MSKLNKINVSSKVKNSIKTKNQNNTKNKPVEIDDVHPNDLTMYELSGYLEYPITNNQDISIIPVHVADLIVTMEVKFKKFSLHVNMVFHDYKEFMERWNNRKELFTAVIILDGAGEGYEVRDCIIEGGILDVCLTKVPAYSVNVAA